MAIQIVIYTHDLDTDLDTMSHAEIAPLYG